MKKVWSLLVCFALFVALLPVAAPGVFAETKYRFEDNFEAYTAGSYAKPNDMLPQEAVAGRYASTGVAVTVKQNDMDASLGQSLYTTAQGAVNTQWDVNQPQAINLYADRMVVEFKVGFPQEAESPSMVLSVQGDQGTDVSSRVEVNSQVLRLLPASFTSGGPRKPLMEAADAVKGRMYHFKIVIQPGSDPTEPATYMVYVDGTAALDDPLMFYRTSYGPPNEQALPLNGINFLTFNGSHFVLDDIYVYADDGSNSIVSSIPADGSMRADPREPILVTFANDLDASSVTPENVMVTGGEAQIDEVSLVDSNQVKITFAQPLAVNTEYTVTFTDLLDTAGVAFTGSFSFTTFDPDATAERENGFFEDFSSYTPGEYANCAALDSTKYSNPGGNWPAQVRIGENPLDPSLGQSAYLTPNAANANGTLFTTFWDAASGNYVKFVKDRFILSVKVGFPEEDSMLAIHLGSPTDMDSTDRVEGQILRTENSGIVNTGGPRRQLFTRQSGRMYTITYVFNSGEAGDAKYDVYIDGVKTAEDVPFCRTTSATTVSGYGYNYFKLEGRNVYIDDLTAYAVTGAGIASTIPANGSQYADITDRIEVQFLSDMIVETIDMSCVSMDGASVREVIPLGTTGMQVVLDGLMEPKTEYTVTIGGVQNVQGDILPDTTISFRTGAFNPYKPGTCRVYLGDREHEITGEQLQEGTLLFDLPVSNSDTTGPHDAALLVALFCENQLIAVNWAKATIPVGGETTLSVTMPFAPADGLSLDAYRVKVMLWQDVSSTNITPIVEQIAALR